MKIGTCRIEEGELEGEVFDLFLNEDGELVGEIHGLLVTVEVSPTDVHECTIQETGYKARKEEVQS